MAKMYTIASDGSFILYENEKNTKKTGTKPTLGGWKRSPFFNALLTDSAFTYVLLLRMNNDAQRYI